MPPSKFRLNLTDGFGGDVIWRIARWRLSWISEWNSLTILNRNSMSLLCLPSSFGSIWFVVWEEMSFEERPSWYLNGTILTILIYVVPMPPIKFWINPTYSLSRDVVWRISSLPLWRPSWISERNDFNNSESTCSQTASHQVSAQSDLRVWRRYRNCEPFTTDDRRRTTGHDISWPGAKLRVS